MKSKKFEESQRQAWRQAIKCWDAAGQVERYRFPLISDRVWDRFFWFLIGVAGGAFASVWVMIFLKGVFENANF